MDLYCPTCGEPWDTTHMREDEPHEWGLSALELRDILATGRFAGDKDRIREAAHAAGWEVATDSVLSFIRCPCCVKATPLRDAIARREAVRVVCELLDGDDDGLAAMREDLGQSWAASPMPAMLPKQPAPSSGAVLSLGQAPQAHATNPGMPRSRPAPGQRRRRGD